jgi:hypothetical protein
MMENDGRGGRKEEMMEKEGRKEERERNEGRNEGRTEGNLVGHGVEGIGPSSHRTEARSAP